jgi:hypothetical protein
MTQNRKKQIKAEAQKRLNQWLKHSTFNKMTVHGSYIRFNMALGLNGYPFAKEKWMQKDEFNNFITDDEFDSIEYDEMITELFYLAQSGKTHFEIEITDTNYFEEKLKENNIIWVTPVNANIIKEDAIKNIFKLVNDIAVKYKDESFNMMPLIENVELITNEVTNAIAVADFIKGGVNMYGIFLYDYTKKTPESVREILKTNFTNPTLN